MSTETAKKPGVEYSVEGGRIFRDDGQKKDQVAKYDPKAGIVEMIPEWSKNKARISAFLNDKGHKFSEFGLIGMDLAPAGLPPKPKKNPRLGDKTPEVVEWYAEHQKDVFLAKFGVRELQVRTDFETIERKVRDDATGNLITVKEQIPIYRSVPGFDYRVADLLTGAQRLIADSKTHLTETFKTGENSDEYDWDLDKPTD